MQLSRAPVQGPLPRSRSPLLAALQHQTNALVSPQACAWRRTAPTHVAAPAVAAQRLGSRTAQHSPRRLCVRMNAAPEASEGGPTVRPVGERERSQLVNEEVVYFIFQLDLDTQLQRCLNYEAYEAAQEVRKKRQRVDEAVQSMKERKAKNTGAPAAVQRLAGADYAAELLRLRTEMQRAVEAEDYATAAKYRDLLKELETEAKKAAALAAEWDTTSPSGPVLRLGQRVLHKQLGYRGVVVGWDMRCCESEDWIAAARVGECGRGISQPFYHLLVDARDWEYDPHLPPVAYVPEELLTSPELEPPAEGAAAADAKPKSWAEVYGTDPLQHPYLYILFLGMDGRGDYVPCRQLRDRYNVQRRDVYKPGQEGGEEDDGAAGGK